MSRWSSGLTGALGLGLVVALVALSFPHPGACAADGSFIENKYRAAARKGDARAQFYIGMIYEDGIGRKPDPVKAFEWYIKSADAGYPPAQFKTGLFYETGRGRVKDLSKAAIYYSMAAEGGQAEASYNLALMYDSGRGVARDREKSLQLLEQAAQAGLVPAMTRLGAMLPELGGEKAVPEAWAWLRRAEDKGDRTAAAIRAGLEKRMTQDQRDNASKIYGSTPKE